LEHRADFSVSLVIFTDGRSLGRGISSSQGRDLYTGQHKHRINAHTDIHALCGIRIHDPGFRASEDSTCLRPLGYRDWLVKLFIDIKYSPQYRIILFYRYYL
jgi:hypothetical protein